MNKLKIHVGNISTFLKFGWCKSWGEGYAYGCNCGNDRGYGDGAGYGTGNTNGDGSGDGHSFCSSQSYYKYEDRQLVGDSK